MPSTPQQVLAPSFTSLVPLSNLSCFQTPKRHRLLATMPPPIVGLNPSYSPSPNPNPSYSSSTTTVSCEACAESQQPNLDTANNRTHHQRGVPTCKPDISPDASSSKIVGQRGLHGPPLPDLLRRSDRRTAAELAAERVHRGLGSEPDIEAPRYRLHLLLAEHGPSPLRRFACGLFPRPASRHVPRLRCHCRGKHISEHCGICSRNSRDRLGF